MPYIDSYKIIGASKLDSDEDIKHKYYDKLKKIRLNKEMDIYDTRQHICVVKDAYAEIVHERILNNCHCPILESKSAFFTDPFN